MRAHLKERIVISSMVAAVMLALSGMAFANPPKIRSSDLYSSYSAGSAPDANAEADQFAELKHKQEQKKAAESHAKASEFIRVTRSESLKRLIRGEPRDSGNTASRGDTRGHSRSKGSGSSSSGFSAYTTSSRTMSSVRINSSRDYVQSTTSSHGRFPGGILIKAEGVFPSRIDEVRYSSKRQQFMINRSVVFESDLDRSEIAAIWAAARSGTGLGALSQDDFFGISEDSTAAIVFSIADSTLGAVAYGYGVAGDIGTYLDHGEYRNPFLWRMQSIKHGDLSSVRRTALNMVSETQVRLFVEFEEVEFAIKGKRLVPSHRGVSIGFQAFRGSDSGNLKFASEGPDAAEPEIAHAVHYMEDHFDEMVSQIPAMTRVVAYADLYALLASASSTGARVTGLGHEDGGSASDGGFDVVYDSYTSSPSRALKENLRRAAKRLVELSGSSELDGQDRFFSALVAINYYAEAGMYRDALGARDLALSMVTHDSSITVRGWPRDEATFRLTIAAIPTRASHCLNLALRLRDSGERSSGHDYHRRGMEEINRIAELDPAQAAIWERIIEFLEQQYSSAN